MNKLLILRRALVKAVQTDLTGWLGLGLSNREE
jgi:hypothetical protein